MTTVKKIMGLLEDKIQEHDADSETSEYYEGYVEACKQLLEELEEMYFQSDPSESSIDDECRS